MTRPYASLHELTRPYAWCCLKVQNNFNINSKIVRDLTRPYATLRDLTRLYASLRVEIWDNFEITKCQNCDNSHAFTRANAR